jgi:hypothetical protein
MLPTPTGGDRLTSTRSDALEDAVAVDEFLVASPRFFDMPDRLDDAGTRFSWAARTPPAGWTAGHRGVWICWQPAGAELPAQGWKIHVSARAADAEETIAIVGEYCLTRGVAFKFLRSAQVATALSAKYASRSSSGKLLTLYPADEASLERTLTELSELTKGRRGPYILSDLRWGSGPLHLRYGAFLEQNCLSDDGTWATALTAPDGRLVPDVRGAVFQCPDWAPVPDFVRDCMTAAESEAGDGLPYDVTGVLHFSNGGGIYRATDPATGDEVVLREARPYAGLDGEGGDAVVRLERERDALRRLAGLPVVPRLLREFTCWEHHFLAEELIPGDRLQHALAQRHPLIYPDPDAEEIADYTRWALAIIDRVAAALDQVHERGLVHGDVHLSNIMLRPDGEIVLIDFEQASGVHDSVTPGLATAGFAAGWARTGIEVDTYALACLRLAIFVPFTQLIGMQPAKAETLLDIVCERFPVPPEFRAQVLDGLRIPATRRSAARAESAATDTDAIAAAILAAATPERDDRLFPGGPGGFGHGALALVNGAAGVLWALAASGVRTAADLAPYTDWLARAAAADRRPPPGLYEGAHGVAYTLDLLGRRAEALDLLARVAPVERATRAAGLSKGIAGAGLTLLHFGFTATAQEYGDRLVALVDGRDAGLAPPGVGLQDGWSGIAAFLVRLYEVSGHPSYLDAAAAAVRRDLDRCVLDRKGGLQVDAPPRYLLYLATGSCGIAMAAHDVLTHRAEPDLRAARDRVLGALRAELVTEPGLFEGRAGLMFTAAYLSGADPDLAAEIIDIHRRRFRWYAIDIDGRPTYPGRWLVRLSMDLATGGAGVLHALHSASRPGAAALPLLDSVRPPLRPVAMSSTAEGR